MIIFTQPHKQHNHERAIARMRDYLAGLENLARRGRLASDPKEVRATVLVFAEPSAALRRLAARDRRCNQ